MGSGLLQPFVGDDRLSSTNLACVRSTMKSRSNWASALNRWKTNVPPVVIVSTPSVRDLKPTPRSPRAVTVSTRCFMDRPRRSSFQTTSVSPLRRTALTAQRYRIRRRISQIRFLDSAFLHSVCEFGRRGFGEQRLDFRTVLAQLAFAEAIRPSDRQAGSPSSAKGRSEDCRRL